MEMESMAGRLPTQKSLLAQWQAKFKASVKLYLKTKEYLDTLPDTASDDEYADARDKERLTRGMVRGMAQCLIILSRPWEADNKQSIADLEIDYGMPGTRSKPRPGVSPTISKWFEEYYAD
jgi:hypothetical protein